MPVEGLKVNASMVFLIKNMANKRMFSKDITESDAFLEMPATSQLLYFHLSMNADDEGFVGNPKKIMRMCGFADDDLKVLIGKRFLLTFESGVLVIKHWLIHNTIRMDRFNPTTYQSEKKLLQIKENKAYTDNWQPNGNQLEPQVKLSKVNLSKDRDTSSLQFLMNLPEEVIKEFSDQFNCYETEIRGKAEDLYNYCLAKGKKYKDYRAFLRNAIKRDFGPRRKDPPKEWEKPENTKVSEEGLKKLRELKDKFKIGK